jgi:hypothetical protein
MSLLNAINQFRVILFLTLQNSIQNLFQYSTKLKNIFKSTLHWPSANLRLFSAIMKAPNYKENLAIPEVISGKTLSAL